MLAMRRGGDEAQVVNNSGTDEVGMAGAVWLKDTCECTHKEEGAEGVALCHPFMERIGDYIFHGEWDRRVCSEVDAGRGVIKEAKP
jgi:hypothetical protein